MPPVERVRAELFLLAVNKQTHSILRTPRCVRSAAVNPLVHESAASRAECRFAANNTFLKMLL